MRGLVGLLTVAALAGCHPPAEVCAEACAPRPAAPPILRFHGDHGLGWNADAGLPGPDRVGQMQLAWSSEPFGELPEAMMYASVLVAEDVQLPTGSHLTLAIGATIGGSVHAVNVFAERCGACGIEAGRTMWQTQLGAPMIVDRLDGGLPLGVLGTPTIDPRRDALYVAALDAEAGWQVHALALATGEHLPGWPVTINDAGLAAVNRNGPARFQRPEMMSQRGALALSPAGDRVYVTFGTYWGEGAGWVIAVDTVTPGIADAFSSAPEEDDVSNGGVWGSAGPAVGADGDVYVTTGNSPPGSEETPGVWGNSLLRFDARLRRQGSYTPFNYCRLDAADLDLAGSQPTLLPPLPDVTTPNVVAFGSKQGNVYLVDRDALRRADGRPPCTLDPAADTSLVASDPQPQFGAPGPLNVFGPYSDLYGMIDQAKMRTKLAYFEDATGRYLFASGSTKAAPASVDNVPPGIAKLRVATPRGEPAYLELDAVNPDVAFVNPGSPVVTSSGPAGAVVWVLDRNAPRSSSPADPAAPKPILYAFDADTLELRWRSPDGAIGPTGKYGVVAATGGTVLVGSDRIQAFTAP